MSVCMWKFIPEIDFFLFINFLIQIFSRNITHKYPMSHYSHLLLISLALIISVSSQVIHLFTSPLTHQIIPSPKSLYKNLSIQHPPRQNNSTNNSSMDLHYIDGCSAILKGFDDVNNYDTSYDQFFAQWENPNPYVQVKMFQTFPNLIFRCSL